jgi:hypothetical protein
MHLPTGMENGVRNATAGASRRRGKQGDAMLTGAKGKGEGCLGRLALVVGNKAGPRAGGERGGARRRQRQGGSRAHVRHYATGDEPEKKEREGAVAHLYTYRTPCCPQNYGVEEGLLKMTSLEMFLDENLINYRFRNISRLPLPLASVPSSSPF